MVKPAMPYLDIMSEARSLAPDHPIACYQVRHVTYSVLGFPVFQEVMLKSITGGMAGQVSGEFAMIHAGATAGVYDLKAMAFESTNGFLRAGEPFSPRRRLSN